MGVSIQMIHDELFMKYSVGEIIELHINSKAIMILNNIYT